MDGHRRRVGRAGTTKRPGRGLAVGPAPGTFSEAEIEGLPEPVQRYFRAAIAPGTPLAQAATLRMRGSIRLGKTWLPFRARQILAPRRGYVWSARVGGFISGSDRYADGTGATDWRLFGTVTLVRVDGPDVSRSAAARALAEAVWLPTTLLPRFGARWSAPDVDHVVAGSSLDATEVGLHMALDGEGRVRSAAFDRWGDPAGTGEWGLYPTGFEVSDTSSFGGLTVPSAGRFGWFFGTPAWPEGEFFRFRLTAVRPVGTAGAMQAAPAGRGVSR
jgi:hypothetical protein